MKRKSSARIEAAQRKVTPAAEEFVHAAADRVGPFVHSAADRVGPLAQSAVDRVGPLAHSAADRVGPLAQSAADRIGPLAQSAADRVAPLAQSAADRVAPLAHQAVDRVSPLAHQAAEIVGPYAHQAAEFVGPYAHHAAERVGPLAHSARQRGAHLAHDAVERLGPRIEDAFDRVSPAVEAARERVTDELLPKLSGALSAAAATPVVVEATKRGKATVAAAKGELALPEQKKKGRWLTRLAIVAALAGIAVFAAKKLLGSKDADWQAARPTTPYAATKPTPPPPTAWNQATDATTSDVTAQSDADQVAAAESEAPTVETPVDVAGPPAESGPGESALAEPAGEDATMPEPEDEESAAEDAPTAEPRYSGEGVYVGTEPPEGYVIKGNERSKKYHVPESRNYSDTIAEVWFNSEEAAQGAGFVRAKT